MILVDYLNVASASIFKAMSTGYGDELSNRFLLGKLRNYNVDFRSEYGELVVCSDHRSWRKDEFKYYKARCKHDEEPPEHIQELMKIRSDVYESLVNHSFFRCVKTYGAEGDDVMYQLSRHPGKHIIISAAILAAIASQLAAVSFWLCALSIGVMGITSLLFKIVRFWLEADAYTVSARIDPLEIDRFARALAGSYGTGKTQAEAKAAILSRL